MTAYFRIEPIGISAEANIKVISDEEFRQFELEVSIAQNSHRLQHFASPPGFEAATQNSSQYTQLSKSDSFPYDSCESPPTQY